MLNLDEIRKKLHDRNLSAVAREIGITPVYMQQIYKGRANNPHTKILEALSDYLEKNR